MATVDTTKSLEIRTLIKESGTLEVSLVEVNLPALQDDELVVRVEAAPINPSDIGLLLAGGDTTAITKLSGDLPAISMPVSSGAFQLLQARIGMSLPVGIEGAGVVVAAGKSPEAQALIGRTVSLSIGGMYSQYRIAKISDCIVFPEGTDPALCAASFVNPMTALGMIETMRRDKHTALVHTAAASNLGRMLNRICIKDGIKLVNIVRGEQQVELLKSEGAQYVCDMNAPTFFDDLMRAIEETGASIAFDATGGGSLADNILTAMEKVMVARMTEYDRYGSPWHKQVYVYGRLNTDPMIVRRAYGSAWGMSGWLLFPFLSSLESKDVERLKARVVAEIDTTFASNYASEVSLADAIDPANIETFNKRSTGNKFLIRPHQ